MSEQLNFLDHYPNNPGWKGKRTSRRAAADIARYAAGTRAKVAAWFRAGNMGSGEECARKIGRDKHDVRSRCSELAGKGILEDTGTTSISRDSGKPATVWRLKP